MSAKNQGSSAEQQAKFAKRDAETQIVLGTFVTVISIPVLIGTLWADTLRAMVVNVIAGLVLLGIGLCIAGLGLKRRPS